MGTLPRKTSELLAFCQERAPIWSLSGATLGLSSSQTTAFTSVTTAAETAYTAQQTALQNSKDATTVANAAIAAMRETAGELLKVIRAYAETATDPALVFSTAKIPPTKAPAPIGPPGTPKDFTLGVDPVGNLHLAWKCQNPPGSQGVIYMIERRLNQTGAFSFVGAAPERSFIDGTVPGGTSIVEYRITGHRAGTVGITGTWSVQFGTGNDGSLALFSVNEMSGKAAA